MLRASCVAGFHIVLGNTYIEAMTSSSHSDIGGYEYDFVDALPDRLICKICDYPNRVPHMSVCCGHNFCKSCLDSAKKATGIILACPICRASFGKFVTFPNKQADRELKSFQILCPNKERGCKWQGELNDVSDHLGNGELEGCKYEDVKCSNTDCKEVIQRRFILSHVYFNCPHRNEICKYCETYDKLQFIKGEHKNQCPKFPLPCPNKCEIESIPREDMEAHRKECPLEVIQCDYHSMGCEEKIIRKRKREHELEHMEEHLLMTKTKLSKTETRLSALEAAVNTLSESTRSGNGLITSAHSSIHLAASIIPTCPITIKISHYARYKRSNATWQSDPFFSHTKGYKMNLGVYSGGFSEAEHTHMSVFLFINKGQYDDELTWPLRGELKIKLLNQLSDDEHLVHAVTYDDTTDHRARRIAEEDQTTYGNGIIHFISNTDLNKVTPTCQFLKDDCIFLQVSKV